MNGWMTLLDRYIIRKFMGTFFYAILLLGVIIPVIFDLTEKIDDVVEKEIPITELVFSYYINFIPYFANLFTPLFLFISVVFFTSRLANRTEITAILCSGVSFYRFLRPYIFSASLIAILSFLLNSFIIPPANAKRLQFEYKYLKFNWNRNFNNLHRQIAPGTFIYMESFVSQSATGYKFTLEKLNQQEMLYKLSADYIRWDSVTGKWYLENFTLRKFSGKKESLIRKAQIDTVFQFRPQDFAYADDDVEMMNYFELNQFIANEQEKGSDFVDYYIYERHRRMANSVATIILTLIAVPMSGRKVRGGTGLHIGLGIGIAFTYVMMMQVSSVFATMGGANPAIAAWIPNLIYFVVALFLIIKAPK
ncbi:MAG: LptF/LptG family permease [Bacteroidia bacterium]|jgi:lipopolysaccharide export system permease protein|nr:LptF/LptG family permease [Bacteroidia bacterium]